MGENRRSVLHSIAIGTVSTVGGCLGRGVSSDSTASILEIKTHYPDFGGYYAVKGTLMDDSERTPVQFEELPSKSQIEVANSIRRTRYLTDQPPQLTKNNQHSEPITYQGSTFNIDISVADVVAKPKHGPDYDSNWREPVTFNARVEDGTLTVTLTNELDYPLDIYHYGRPYFGVLTAINGTTVLLSHEQYDANEYIQTEDVIRAISSHEIERQAKSLSPGNSLRESYALPNDLPDESTIWLSLPIGDESIKMFGNRIRTVTTNISIRNKSN